MTLQTIEWETSLEPVPYPEAVAFMEARIAAIREGTANPLIWLVEHPPLYTAGTSAKEDDLLDASRFPVFESGRGGQFTYHGPGQRVVYVMLDLKHPLPGISENGPDLRRFVHFLESWMTGTLRHYGLKGKVYPERVGVWLDMPDGSQAKIGAIGIRVRQWVTYHGFALNVHPDLSHFSGIIPCGIREHGVTSLAALGKTSDMAEVDALLKREFERLMDSA